MAKNPICSSPPLQYCISYPQSMQNCSTLLPCLFMLKITTFVIMLIMVNLKMKRILINNYGKKQRKARLTWDKIECIAIHRWAWVRVFHSFLKKIPFRWFLLDSLHVTDFRNKLTIAFYHRKGNSIPHFLTAFLIW